MTCWADQFRAEHERWIAHYPPREQEELRAAREAWLRSTGGVCCKTEG